MLIIIYLLVNYKEVKQIVWKLYVAKGHVVSNKHKVQSCEGIIE